MQIKLYVWPCCLIKTYSAAEEFSVCLGVPMVNTNHRKYPDSWCHEKYLINGGGRDSAGYIFDIYT